MRNFRANVWWSLLLGCSLCSTLVGQQDGSDLPITTLRTTVRRVVIDVVVTGRDGKPVSGLAKEDFTIYEDNKEQKALSFEAYGFSNGMDYVPAKMPSIPTNTFINLPKTPERGPLYVLLYDLVNTESADQIFARKQLVKFIQEKPEGTRFAIFMLSDGLHLVQGFTSDKSLLAAAIDPSKSHPHVPKIFLMQRNFGQDDNGTSVWVLNYLAKYLDGMPGRKNLIWLSGSFPLSLFPTDKDSADYISTNKDTLDMLAREQISIYPVDVRGVSVEDAHAPSGSTGGGGMSSDSRASTAQGANSSSGSSSSAPSGSSSGSSSPGAGAPGAAPASASATGGGVGYSVLASSYMTEDQIARVTGGRAFYSTNDVKAALVEATEHGSNYYTLSYEPSNREETKTVRNIRVDLAKKGYTLAYRHNYYRLDQDATAKVIRTNTPSAKVPWSGRKIDDTLSTNMEHGAPVTHALIFGAHIRGIGGPVKGTPEQMAQLSDQPAFFKTRRKNASGRPLAPIDLQQFTIDFTITARQLQAGTADSTPQLEIAAAAYDEDGKMLNAIVNEASAGDTAGASRRTYRIEEVFFAPANARFIRLAVRDIKTDRTGAMEVSLPLAPEAQGQTVSSSIPQHP